MTKLPKGPLKVIHFKRGVLRENQLRRQVSAKARLIPVVTVHTKLGATEGYEVRMKGEVRVRYSPVRFPLSHEYGSVDNLCWLETNEAIEIAERPGELDEKPEEKPAE